MHHVTGLPSERQAALDEAPSHAVSFIPITAARRRRAFLRRLAAMNPKQRCQAAQAGHFTRAERALWASTYPAEVPLVNGELPWIALGLADID